MTKLLNWHTWRRADGRTDEYATDRHGMPAYLIQGTVLHEGDVHICGTGKWFVYWNEVWECDSGWQARMEAEMRHKHGNDRAVIEKHYAAEARKCLEEVYNEMVLGKHRRAYELSMHARDLAAMAGAVVLMSRAERYQDKMLKEYEHYAFYAGEMS